MKISSTAIRLIVLAILTLLLLNFPFLSTANHTGLTLGIPTLFFYIFLVWMLVIISANYFSRDSKQKQDKLNE